MNFGSTVICKSIIKYFIIGNFLFLKLMERFKRLKKFQKKDKKYMKLNFGLIGSYFFKKSTNKKNKKFLITLNNF